MYIRPSDFRFPGGNGQFPGGHRIFTLKNGLLPIIGAGLVLLILYFFRETVSSPLFFRLEEHMTRINIWKSCLNIIRDYPLFGVGPGNFGAVYERYKPEIFIAKNLNVTCAHSNYLTVFIGWGLVGGLLFLGLAVICYPAEYD